MLNELPDDVLCHILSFLPTKTSMSTSVLAKRWRFMWAHVLNLQFNVNNFRYEAEPLDIMNKVVMLHQAKVVNTFSLRLTALKGCASLLLTLITLLIKRNVRNLYIEFYCTYDEYGGIVCTLPRLLSTCKTLVDLKLVHCGVISSSEELSFPSLKKLYLKSVEYEDDESLPHLLSGCPLLEELIVNDRFRKGQKKLGCIIVSSPSIKRLTIDFVHGLEESNDEMLVIDVPALLYLKVERCDLERVRSLRETMTSLIEVDIALSRWHYCEVGCTKHGRSIEFLSCLCHVKCLKIKCGFQLKLVGLVGTPMFVHLTKLQLDFNVDSSYLVEFLEVADNLEVLTINLGKAPDTLPCKELKRVPPCMSSSLRSVTVYNFSAYVDGFETVRYVLRNARALEKMEIHAKDGYSDKEKLDVFRRISLYERGSKSCELVFDTNNSRGHIALGLLPNVKNNALTC